VNNPEACRQRAADCFLCAQFAATEEARVAWLNMAQMWLQLAQHMERQARQSERPLAADDSDEQNPAIE
jgi:hypothetical protein